MNGETFDPASFLGAAGPGRTIRYLKPGTILFEQGETASLIFYIHAGRIKESVSAEGGKEVVVAMHGPGRIIGMSSLFKEMHRTSTMTTVTTCRLTEITRPAMLGALTDHSWFANHLMAYLIEEANRLRAEHSNILLSSRERRLALKLLELSHNGADTIGPEVTREDLANLIGTTRPYTSLILTRFRRQGLIQYKGGIVVLPKLLEALGTRTSVNQQLKEGN